MLLSSGEVNQMDGSGEFNSQCASSEVSSFACVNGVNPTRARPQLHNYSILLD